MSGSKFVFCEGKDDVSVIKCITESIKIFDLRIEEFTGRANIRKFLKNIWERPEFAKKEVSSVGSVRDADDNGAAAFQSVRDALLAHGFAAPDANGRFVEGAIKIGIFVVGPNDGRGMLEDLCLNSVSDQPEFGCVDGYFRCIAEKSERKKVSSKARFRAWMASHTDLELRLGLTAEKGYWPWESTAFDPLKAFLRQL